MELEPRIPRLKVEAKSRSESVDGRSTKGVSSPVIKAYGAIGVEASLEMEATTGI